jgi:hypothetical protein
MAQTAFTPATAQVPASATTVPVRPGTVVGLARRVAAWALANVAIALVLALAQRNDFLPSLLYSECIGLACVLAIDGGRVVVAHLRVRLGGSPYRDPDWPGWPWMIACIVGGVPLGYLLGLHLADLVTGQRSLLDDDRWRNATMALAISGLAAGVGSLVGFNRSRLIIARTEAETARRIAAEGQLQLLQAQLEPHMLFNTLANLRALIVIEPAQAQQMLDRLIAFLRATLGASRAPLHPLSDECGRIADYLALMAVRMGPRLSSTIDLPAALADVAVPVLLLQPLVENAIRHGLEPKVGGGRIAIRIERDGERLVMTVRDTGVGLDAASPTADTGFGTGLVRDRIAMLYGPTASLTLAAADDAEGGTLARIDVPLMARPEPRQ